MIIPVIMAGGSGTRLWPLSRTAFPKQFIALTSSLTMLQETAARINGLSGAVPMVICNEEHRFLVAEQMRRQNLQPSILLEPVGRNTAPAIALAAIKVLDDAKTSSLNATEAPVLLVLAADHVIDDVDAFQQCVVSLLPEVQAGKFGTLGIVPTEAAIGYGYIKAEGTCPIKTVNEFVEKPDAEAAGKYVADGYLWNSGMFLIRADRYLDELKNYRADIYDACVKSMADTQQDLDFVRINKAAFEACPDESIDFAVMEPLAAKGLVIVKSLDAGWSDVGSWSALWEIADKDEQGNVVAGQDKENFILQGSENCYVYGSENSEGSGRLIATLGVDNLVIVDTPDALLVANKDKVQDIKMIVAEIKATGGTLHHQHRKVYRPWGVYDSIDSGHRYQVKRITVNPGAKLSVQMHHHRAEHWIVVSGIAKVTNGENTFLVAENESTYIPIGQIHALENPGVLPLEMIEVQSGSYLGEDDIVRFEDRYGRS
jgi:mannose-1-phosphate guanylyltransferase